MALVRWSTPITVAALSLAACTEHGDLGPTAEGPMAVSPPAANPVAAYYPLDGNAVDLGRAAANGQLNGGVVPTLDRFGHSGAALAFDGTSGYVVLPGASTDNKPSGTINLWLRTASSSDTGRCDRPDLTPTDPMFCDYNIFAKKDPANAPVFRGQFGSFTAPGARINTWYFMPNGNSMLFAPSAAYSFDSWHMYTFVWSPTSTILYFDGDSVASGPSVGASVTGDLYLGSNSTTTAGSRERFEGAMDDLTIYDTALSAAEIAVLSHSPLSKEACKSGGWANFGFRNQGQCVRYVETGKDSR